MIKHTRTLLFNILVLTVGSTLQSTAEQPTQPDIRFFQEKLHKNTNILHNLENQVATLNKQLQPSKTVRMGKAGIVLLAAYGTYTLYNEYQESDYKPVVDEKINLAKSLYSLIMQGQESIEELKKEEN